VRWGQRKCRPGRHLGGEVVHLANPTSVTCSAYRDNDDCASGWSWRGYSYNRPVRVPCALCNRLWYGVGGFAVTRIGKPSMRPDLAPPQRGFFVRVPCAVQPTVVLSRWVCRCRKRQAPSMETLAPLRRGFFCAGPPRSAQPTARLGVGVVGLLCFRRDRQARLWQQT
jgi:hypothetical protein